MELALGYRLLEAVACKLCKMGAGEWSCGGISAEVRIIDVKLDGRQRSFNSQCSGKGQNYELNVATTPRFEVLVALSYEPH